MEGTSLDPCFSGILSLGIATLPLKQHQGYQFKSLGDLKKIKTMKWSFSLGGKEGSLHDQKSGLVYILCPMYFYLSIQ